MKALLPQLHHRKTGNLWTLNCHLVNLWILEPPEIIVNLWDVSNLCHWSRWTIPMPVITQSCWRRMRCDFSRAWHGFNSPRVTGRRHDFLRTFGASWDFQASWCLTGWPCIHRTGTGWADGGSAWRALQREGMDGWMDGWMSAELVDKQCCKKKILMILDSRCNLAFAAQMIHAPSWMLHATIGLARVFLATSPREDALAAGLDQEQPGIIQAPLAKTFAFFLSK